uniref:Class I SAM-dependent methyltransferase n=1 Tax=Ignisphaera aggregans TaxID=334771 RepID=A0A7J3YTP9_9CREN
MILSDWRDVRQRETLKALISFLRKTPLPKPQKYLDLGCGDGSFTLKVAEVLNASEIYGVDVASEVLSQAEGKGIKTFVIDLNTSRLPFADGEFDIITAFEVIEHLWNTDNMISEAFRVLKRGGLFILTTPNLASWVNRLLILFGYLPVHYGCSLKYELEKRPLQSTVDPCEHVRLYTFKTLKKHLEVYGFRVVHSTSYSMGYVTSNPIVRTLNKLFSIRKTLGAGMFFVATK